MAQTAGGTYYAASSELVSSWPATSLDLANQLESRFAAKYTTGGAWTSYTPSWTNLTVGNGTVTAAYLQIGKVVHTRIELLWGSTTTVPAPANLWLPGLPVTPKAGVGALTGTAFYYDASAGLSNSGIYIGNFAMLHSSSQGVLGTSPWTWAVNDQLRVNITYEAA